MNFIYLEKKVLDLIPVCAHTHLLSLSHTHKHRRAHINILITFLMKFMKVQACLLHK